MNVLLVEDSDVVRREMERLLDDLPAVSRIAVADGVERARDAIDRDAFDAWVLDFDLGDGTALDLIESLAGHPRADRPYVFVVTNHASTALRERCLGAGADRFFDKSAELDDLVAALQERTPGPTAA